MNLGCGTKLAGKVSLLVEVRLQLGSHVRHGGKIDLSDPGKVFEIGVDYGVQR